MSSVVNICITSESGKKMESINSIKVIANKGIVNDRYFKEDNVELYKINKYLSYDSQNKIKKNLKSYKINENFFSNLEFIKSSGKHKKEGIMLYKNILIKKKFISKKKLENHKIFQIIWDFFQ